MQVVYLDTETTGVGAEDRLCQIAFLVEKREDMLLGVGEAIYPPTLYADLCKPPLAISAGATSINHITNEMVEGKPAFAQSESAKELERLNDARNTLVIHNAPFDLAMLAKEGFKWRGQVLDTLRVARHIYDTESHALQFLRNALGLYRKEAKLATSLRVKPEPHNAIGDVLALYLLVSDMLVKRPMEELIELCQKPIKLEKIRFGKYKGREFEEIVKDDPDYLCWLAKSEREKTDQNADLLHTIDCVFKTAT
ncbi:MAG: 3'-5' exonuclease [Helicobacteraceae bacterium]|nr:3'-5' exonuclease [Helicobacteraceae bacterium]